MPREEYDWCSVVREFNPQGYCEIQNPVDGIVIHGPVEGMTVAEGMVYIRMKWVAKTGLPGQPSFGKWTRAAERFKVITFPDITTPFTLEATVEKGQRIRFGTNIIYIDPQPESDERILAAISE